MGNVNVEAVIELLTEKIQANDRKIEHALDEVQSRKKLIIGYQESVEELEAENWGYEFAIKKLKGEVE